MHQKLRLRTPSEIRFYNSNSKPPILRQKDITLTTSPIKRDIEYQHVFKFPMAHYPDIRQKTPVFRKNRYFDDQVKGKKLSSDFLTADRGIRYANKSFFTSDSTLTPTIPIIKKKLHQTTKKTYLESLTPSRYIHMTPKTIAIALLPKPQKQPFHPPSKFQKKHLFLLKFRVQRVQIEVGKKAECDYVGEVDKIVEGEEGVGECFFV